MRSTILSGSEKMPVLAVTILLSWTAAFLRPGHLTAARPKPQFCPTRRSVRCEAGAAPHSVTAAGTGTAAAVGANCTATTA